MKKSYIYTIVALIAASIAVAIAFFAGKQWDQGDEDPNQDNQDLKNDQDDKN